MMGLEHELVEMNLGFPVSKEKIGDWHLVYSGANHILEYRRNDGLSAIIFRGTTDAQDVVDDLSLYVSGNAFSSRLNEALSYAYKVAKTGRLVICVGHSLGGLYALKVQEILYPKYPIWAWAFNPFVPDAVSLRLNRRQKLFLNMNDPVCRITYQSCANRPGRDEAKWVFSWENTSTLNHGVDQWL